VTALAEAVLIEGASTGAVVAVGVLAPTASLAGVSSILSVLAASFGANDLQSELWSGASSTTGLCTGAEALIAIAATKQAKQKTANHKALVIQDPKSPNS
jgi:hypothetical protein